MSTPRPSRDVTSPRPNANSKWICGYQRLGIGCKEGPDEKGNCCQLRPDRSRPAENAVCHQECDCNADCELAHLRRKPELPSHIELGPCLPQRAAWFSRQTLALNLALLAGGALLLSMTLPQREAIFVPGGLTQKHAQILGNHVVSERCSLCHAQAHATSLGAAVQDELCLRCHLGHLPAANLRSPHDLTTETLTKLTTKANPYVALNPQPASQQTSCAMCHVEHRGSGFDLKMMSDASCQSCHQQQFASLTSGHPQFEDYPYRVPRHIAFDHAAHQDKHFGTKNEVFNCNRCHLGSQSDELLPESQAGGRSSLRRTTSFEQACASCHQATIESSSMQGWALLQLPSIEATDARPALPELANWPSTARFGYEGEIAVPLRLLLAADPTLRTTLELLPISGQLQQLPQEGELRAQATRAIAAGIRRLIADVAREGHVALRNRLTTSGQQLLGRDLTVLESQLVDHMLNGLPPDLFRHMEQAWFGAGEDLAQRPSAGIHMVSQPVDDDDLLHDDGLLSDSDDPLLSDDDLLSTDDLLGGDSLLNDNAELDRDLTRSAPDHFQGWSHVAAGGWYLDQELLALRYMPSGHADPTLAAWATYIALLEHAAPAKEQPGELPAIQKTKLIHGQTIPGGCTQCHLLQRQSTDRAFAFQWTSFRHAAAERPFTKFDHRPHLTLPTLSDCSYCHEFDGGRTSDLTQLLSQAKLSLAAMSEGEWTRIATECLAHEFADMRLEQCSACHHPQAAPDSCIQCHRYHVRGSDW